MFRGLFAAALALVTLAWIDGARAADKKPAAYGKSAPAFKIELIVRTINNFKSPQDVAAFFDLAHKAGVAVVHVNAKQDEDDERPSGQVYYASAIAPVAHGYENFDALAVSVAEAHRRGIKLFAWLPQFHDQEAVRRNPSWQMMASENQHPRPYVGKDSVEYFVNPIDPDVQAYQLSLIEELVKNYAVDGVDLDWLRFDDLNMDVGPVTRQIAVAELGLDPMELAFSVPSMPLTRWNYWRAGKIAAYTKRVRETVKAIRPSVRIAAFVLPPEFTEVGQDLVQISPYLDEVLPMAYFTDWKFSADWVSAGLMRDAANKTAKGATLKLTLDGTGSFADNVAILAATRKYFPDTDSIVWFTAAYWQPQAIARIVEIHKAAQSR